MRGDRRSRRLLALLLAAWLGLLAQPCIAGMPAASLEHCDHAGTPDRDMACHSVQAVDCEMSADLHAGSPPADWQPAADFTALLPLAEGAMPARGRAMLRARTTGPPLTIRFCNLRN